MGVILNDPARLCKTVSITCSRSAFSAGPVHERQDRCYLDCILSRLDREYVEKVLPIGPIQRCLQATYLPIWRRYLSLSGHYDGNSCAVQ